MLDWIDTHHTVLNVIISFAMLIVWLMYLQVFLMTIIRQKRSKIIINKVAGSSYKSHCFISNMSAETIYITALRVSLHKDNDNWTAYITDFENASDTSEKKAADMTYQGPIGPGGFYDLGSFENIIRCVQERTDALQGILQQESFSMEFKVLGFYSSEKLPIGAYRSFIYKNGQVKPTTAQTFQVRSHWKRKQIASELNHYYTC